VTAGDLTSVALGLGDFDGHLELVAAEN
jgi:hypothetical protein